MKIFDWLIRVQHCYYLTTMLLLANFPEHNIRFYNSEFERKGTTGWHHRRTTSDVVPPNAIHVASVVLSNAKSRCNETFAVQECFKSREQITSTMCELYIATDIQDMQSVVWKLNPE